MRYWRFKCVAIAALAAACVVGTAAQRGAEQHASREVIGLPRVRSTNQTIRAALDRGAADSPSFRGLVARLESGDGLVFIEPGNCRWAAQACLWSTVTVAGPLRVLRVTVNLKAETGCRLGGVIAHELQHAVEVLSDPNVRSNAAMVDFLQREAKTGSSVVFETDAALTIGAEVEREVCHPSRPEGH